MNNKRIDVSRIIISWHVHKVSRVSRVCTRILNAFIVSSGVDVGGGGSCLNYFFRHGFAATTKMIIDLHISMSVYMWEPRLHTFSRLLSAGQWQDGRPFLIVWMDIFQCCYQQSIVDTVTRRRFACFYKRRKRDFSL